MRRVILMLVLALGTPTTQAQAPPMTSCQAAIPAPLAGAGAATWLGPCAGRWADGLGVLRVVGTDAANQRFFFGLMVAERPQRGVVTTARGLLEVAPGFDAGRRIVAGDGADASPTDAAILAVMEGARATARRFDGAGNAPSAAHYHEWARRLGVE